MKKETLSLSLLERALIPPWGLHPRDLFTSQRTSPQYHPTGHYVFNISFLAGEIILLEKTLQSPLDYKKIKPVDPKGNQP